MARRQRRAATCRLAVHAHGSTERGCVFTSTGTVTVLKFNSAFRYLSYLSPDDYEQREALALTLDPAALNELFRPRWRTPTSSGHYMTARHPERATSDPANQCELHARVRGLETPLVEVLDGPTWMPMDDDPRGYDWYGLERDADRTWRWSGPNPRPRLLIPFTHDGPVRLSLHVDVIATDDVREFS